MDMTPAPTWWEKEHAFLCEIAEDPSEMWADAGPPFSDALLQLLAEVEDAFALTGADTPGWADPHVGSDGEDREALKEEYSRCLDPGKYRILWARAEAWARVLTARGWARKVDIQAGADDGTQVDWVIPPRVHRYRTTVLRPRRPGAQPLVLARTALDDAVGSTDLAGREAMIMGLVVGIGDPAVPVSTTPDCGCDACDSGSRDLLEELDCTLLSIVDGSYEVTHTPQGHSKRTSFSAGGRQRGRRPRHLRAAHRRPLGRGLDSATAEPGDHADRTRPGPGDAARGPARPRRHAGGVPVRAARGVCATRTLTHMRAERL